MIFCITSFLTERVQQMKLLKKHLAQALETLLVGLLTFFLPNRHTRKRTSSFHKALSISVPLVFLMLLGAFLIVRSHDLPVKPGGGWISPKSTIIPGLLRFAAYAYPTVAGDPPIDHVNFTVDLHGHWMIGCSAHTPMMRNMYACQVDLQKLGALPGEPLTISFDVYDQAGNRTLAPHGLRSVIYLPEDAGASTLVVESRDAT
jgi:hypothetical protein